MSNVLVDTERRAVSETWSRRGDGVFARERDREQGPRQEEDGADQALPGRPPAVSLLAKIPADLKLLQVMGRILSHGYLVSGFLPVRLSLPCLILMLLGNTNTKISDGVLLEAFLNYISISDCATIRRARAETSFSKAMETELIFACRQIPNSANLNALLQKAAQFEFCIKPAAALCTIHSGMPESHHPFWTQRGVDGVVSLYKSLSVTASAILNILQCSYVLTGDQERIFSYLILMIGNMQPKQLQFFLRFVTGSSSLVTKSIGCLTGTARRPIAHTCSSSLELSSQYMNYGDFERDFFPIMEGAEYVWDMDSV